VAGRLTWLERDGAPGVVSNDRTFLDPWSCRIVATEREQSPAPIWQLTARHWSSINTAWRAGGQPVGRLFDRQQKELGRQQGLHRPIPGPVPPRSTQARAARNCWRKWTGSRPRWRASPASSRFPEMPPLRAQVALIENLSPAYGSRSCFSAAGPGSGAGRKSHRFSWDPWGQANPPCLRLIMGLGAADEGHLPTWGSTRGGPAYLEQNQAEALDLGKKPVIETLCSRPADWTQTQVRSMLGKVLFAQHCGGSRR